MKLINQSHTMNEIPVIKEKIYLPSVCVCVCVCVFASIHSKGFNCVE